MSGKGNNTVNILRSAYVGPDGMANFVYNESGHTIELTQKDGSRRFDRSRQGWADGL